MTFQAERQIKRGPYEVLVDRDTDSQEVRVAVYRGDILLAIEFVQSLDTTIERMVGLAAKRSPEFPAGDRA